MLAPKWLPKGSRNRAKIDKKTIQKSIGILVGLLKGLGSVFDQFWERFGDPGPSKMNVSCRRGAIFQKFTFLGSDSFLKRFLIDFHWFWDPFWHPKCHENGFGNR